MVGLGVAVGHSHFSQRGAVENGSLFAVVGVADGVAHQSFAGGKANAHFPLLPADLVAFGGEAGAFGLNDLQGFEVGAEILDVLLGVVAVFGGQGHHTVVFNPDYLHLVQIHHGDDAFDRAGVAVIGEVGPHPAEGAGEADAVFVLQAIVASRPGVNHPQAGDGAIALPAVADLPSDVQQVDARSPVPSGG